MAAGILRHLAGRRIYVESAGVRTGQQDPFVTIVMDEIGIDVSKHKPIAINDLHDTNFDLVVTLTPEAHHQALEFTRTMAVDVDYWPTLDPTLVTGNRDQVLEFLSHLPRYAVQEDQEFLQLRSGAKSVSTVSGIPPQTAYIVISTQNSCKKLQQQSCNCRQSLTCFWQL